jgi:hypothetical protein
MFIDSSRKFYQVVKAARRTVIIREVKSSGGIPMVNKFAGEKICRKVYHAEETHIKISKGNKAYVYSEPQIIKKAA